MTQLHYKPLYRTYQLHDLNYQIIDSKQADNRSLHFAFKAESCDDMHKNKYLRLATDYGCQDSPYYLARRILEGGGCADFSLDDAIIFLNIAADRGCQQAAFEMACCYIGRDDYPEILQAGVDFFAALSTEERDLLAQYYFSIAKGEET